jgi:hypothetical protein
MNLSFILEPYDILTVHLRDGNEQTTVSAQPASAAVSSLCRALDAALTEGYGECFWPGATGGQYWWIFKRDDERLETIAMWTRGGASLWEHVFRATDAASWVDERVRSEAERLRLE